MPKITFTAFLGILYMRANPMAEKMAAERTKIVLPRPIFSSRIWMMGARASWPTPDPAAAIPVARPRFLRHRSKDDSVAYF